VVDAAATAVGKSVGTVLGTGITAVVLTQIFPSLHNAFDAIIKWLEIAAKMAFFSACRETKSARWPAERSWFL
jgi:hypothetical protein